MTDHDRAAARPEIAVNRAAAVEAGSPAGRLQDEVHLGESRIDAEDVVRLVAVAATQKVGIVFGELAGGRSEYVGCGSTQTIGRRAMAPLRCARHVWRSPDTSPPCRWWSAHPASRSHDAYLRMITSSRRGRLVVALLLAGRPDMPSAIAFER